MSETSKAMSLASNMKGLDTSKVEVDDEDQAPPTIAAGSKEERALLVELEALLPAECAGVSQEIKLMCLRGRKYDPARGAALVPDLLALIGELGLDKSDPAMWTQISTGKVCPTGAKDAQGRAIVWLRFARHEPRVYDAKKFGALIATMMLRTLRDPDVARCGIVIIQDMRGISLSNLDPSAAKFVFGHVFPRLPVRVGRIVAFHPPWIVGHVILPIVMAFMSKKLKARKRSPQLRCCTFACS